MASNSGTIGQIIYNVDGVGTSINTKTNETYKQTDLTTDLFGAGAPFEGKQFTKLGVQAEPGTRMCINGNEIIIGRTGIYELDERIIVTGFYLIPDPIWILDENATQTAKETALGYFEKVAINPWTFGWDGTIKDKDNNEIKDEKGNPIKLSDWITNTRATTENFNAGYAFYLQGENGIYTHKTDENDNLQYRDFYNIIIDYIVTTRE